MTNYHMHTELCNHAEGTIEEVICRCIEVGYTEIGLSEHAPIMLIDDKMRLTMDNYEYYINEAYRLRDKYSDKITIYVGFEIEYLSNCPEQLAWIKELNTRVDYLILANHYIGDINSGELRHFSSQNTNDQQVLDSIDLMEEGWKTGLFNFIAHPDSHLKMRPNFETIGPQFLKKFEAFLTRNPDVVLELNANGLISTEKYKDIQCGYTLAETVKLICESGVKTFVNSDSHKLSDFGSKYELELRKTAKKYNANIVKLF